MFTDVVIDMTRAVERLEKQKGHGDCIPRDRRKDSAMPIKDIVTAAITRILVPVDFSAHSDRAVAYATTVGARFGASVELLHVVENPVMSGAWSSEVSVPDLTEIFENMIADAERRLADVKTTAQARGVAVTTTVLTGLTAPAILELATTGAFDLIVMGTHGRTGLSHVFMGSVAEQVLRRSPCPVLTVRAETPAAEQPSGVRKTAA